MEDARIRRWHRISELAIDADELRELRAAVSSVCAAPHDPIARQNLRALTDSRTLYDQAVPLLSIEARTQDNPVVLAALRDEARYVCEHVYRPVERLSVLEEKVTSEPDNWAHLERLAWMYYLVGAWVQAAQTLERLAPYIGAEDALVILRAAGRLYRNSGRNDRALIAYRAVALRKPSDVGALMALADLMVAPTGEPDSRFDPPPPPATVARPRKAPAQQPAPRAPSESPAPRPGRDTQRRMSPAAPVPEENQNPVILTNRQAAADAHDLFASLEDGEIEGSLAFAFGDDDNPFRELAEPPPVVVPKKRNTRERDGLLRPPARDEPVVPHVDPLPDITEFEDTKVGLPASRAPAQSPPAIAIPATPVMRITRPSGSHTVIDLDEIIDAPGQVAEAAVPIATPTETSAGVISPEVARIIEEAKRDARAGDLAAAERLLRSLLENQPYETSGHLALVDLYRANDRLADADAHLRDAIAAAAEAGSHRAALLHRHALVTGARGDADAAYTMLQAAFESDPYFVPALRALATAAEQRGNQVQAIELLEQLLAAHRTRGAIRETAETCELLARLVTDEGRRQLLAEEAIATYEELDDFERADALAIWLHRPVRQPHTQ